MCVNCTENIFCALDTCKKLDCICRDFKCVSRNIRDRVFLENDFFVLQFTTGNNSNKSNDINGNLFRNLLCNDAGNHNVSFIIMQCNNGKICRYE